MLMIMTYNILRVIFYILDKRGAGQDRVTEAV